ncbi:hypothetical protein QVD17_04781 [Tagetes erecta]|uniref:Uncharacterized protein n=1 Tax=Tagetes erecta TaxID=13708 RepID=A0AAD8LG64_TARER|nr:hypothetical protein QVD17_04781 [Tagetes erecta]
MCYRVVCKNCGNYGWGGCGKHLKTLYASIEEGKHCLCRSWPGVVIPSSQNMSSTVNDATSTTTSGTLFLLISVLYSSHIFNRICNSSHITLLRILSKHDHLSLPTSSSISLIDLSKNSRNKSKMQFKSQI